MSWMCCKSYTNEDSEQTRKSRKIDAMLAKDKRQFRKQVKLLLLGAGESGKSTFLKQMKIIHGQSLIDDMNTVEEYREIIYSNILKGMKVLIDARNKLSIDWGSEDSISHAHHVFSFDNKVRISGLVFRQYVQSISQLWSDSGIQLAFERRVEFQLVFHSLLYDLNPYFMAFFTYRAMASDIYSIIFSESVLKTMCPLIRTYFTHGRRPKA